MTTPSGWWASRSSRTWTSSPRTRWRRRSAGQPASGGRRTRWTTRRPSLWWTVLSRSCPKDSGSCSARSGWSSTRPAPSQQAALRGPAGQLVARGELELAQHGAHVGLDGLDRDEQLGGDLLVGVAARDQPHHLPLALGQPVEVLVDLGHLDRAREGVEHEAGESRREDRVAGGHAA